MTATRYRNWAWPAILAVLCTGILIALSSGNGPAHQAFANDPTVEARITPLDNAGKALSDAATSASGVTIQGMFFDISNDDALMQTARGNAFADAKSRATQYAQLAGRSLGRVEKIDETVDNGGPIFYGKDVAAAASGTPVPISPGTQTLTLNV